MISLSQLNKLIQIFVFFSALIFNYAFAEEAVDIWKENENQNETVYRKIIS